MGNVDYELWDFGDWWKVVWRPKSVNESHEFKTLKAALLWIEAHEQEVNRT